MYAQSTLQHDRHLAFFQSCVHSSVNNCGIWPLRSCSKRVLVYAWVTEEFGQKIGRNNCLFVTGLNMV